MLLILAQQNPNFGNPGGPPPAANAAAAGVLTLVLLFYGLLCCMGLVAFAIKIVELIALSKCLSEVEPRNRTMEPGQVWLNLIPLFSLVWIFITVIRVAESLRNEFEERNLEGDDDYGQTMGIVTAALWLAFFPAGIICSLIYRSKVGGYTRELQETEPAARPRRRRRDYDEEDDDYEDDRDDDRPRRRPRD